MEVYLLKNARVSDAEPHLPSIVNRFPVAVKRLPLVLMDEYSRHQRCFLHALQLSVACRLSLLAQQHAGQCTLADVNTAGKPEN